MADTSVPVTSGSGNNIDGFSLANANIRQAVVIGDSSIVNNVAPIQATDPTSATQGLVVRDVNTSAIVSRLGSTIFVQLDPGHTLGAVTVGGTMAVYFDQSAPTVKAIPSTGTFTVAFDPGHELGSIKGNTNTLTIFIPDTGHTIGKVDAGAGTFTFKTDPGYELGSIKGINSSINVYIGATAGTIGVRVGQVDGTVAVYFSQSKPTVLADSQHTASIFTVSGSTSGISVSGVNLIAPSANASFKIFAFSVQTTAQVSLNVRFVNGAGGGQTEFWRPLITASGVTGAQGANLAVPSPSHLFATGTNTSLNILLDSASLVHYSVSYLKESA